jgi:hypothetical protein
MITAEEAQKIMTESYVIKRLLESIDANIRVWAERGQTMTRFYSPEMETIFLQQPDTAHLIIDTLQRVGFKVGTVNTHRGKELEITWVS